MVQFEGILIVTENIHTLFTYLVCSPRHIRIHQILSQPIITLVPDVVTTQTWVLLLVPVPVGVTAGRWRGGREAPRHGILPRTSMFSLASALIVDMIK